MKGIVSDEQLPLGALCANPSHVRKVKAEFVISNLEGENYQIPDQLVCAKHVTWPLIAAVEREWTLRLEKLRARMGNEQKF